MQAGRQRRRTLRPQRGSSPLRMAGKPLRAASATMMAASAATMSTPACAAVSRLRILYRSAAALAQLMHTSLSNATICQAALPAKALGVPLLSVFGCSLSAMSYVLSALDL